MSTNRKGTELLISTADLNDWLIHLFTDNLARFIYTKRHTMAARDIGEVKDGK